MFYKNGLIGIRRFILGEMLDNQLQGEILDIDINEGSFNVNVLYTNDKDLKIDMKSMNIDDDSLEDFKDEREFFSYKDGFKLSLSLKDVSQLINKLSGETLSSSLQYFYDYENDYIQLITE